MRPIVARQARRLLVHRASAPSCAVYAISAARRTSPRLITPRSFQRTFLAALLQKPPRQVRHPEYEPGWLQIMLWRSRMLDRLRPPPRKELVEAWKKLMHSKIKSRTPLNSTQALQCRRLLEFLTDSSTSQETKPLSSVDLSMARQVLLEIEPRERSQNHIALAKSLYKVWEDGNYSGKARSLELQWSHLVKIMCRFGGSKEALQMLLSKWNDPAYAKFLNEDDRLMEEVASGLAREGHEKELVDLVKHAEAHGIPYDSGIQEVVACFFAQRDRVSETQHWFAKPIDQAYSRAKVYRAIASFAARNRLEDWATATFLKLGQSNPPKKHWDALLQALLLLGKSVKDVDTVMANMLDRNGSIYPDVHTFNKLLRVAVEARDSRLAEDLLVLLDERKISRNGETSLVLLNLHVELGNLNAAQELFRQVFHSEPWNNESSPGLLEEFRHLANGYLVACARQPRPDFDLILNILESVDEGNISLDPETVASLCLRFLENDQHFDVMDILSIHSFMYSEAQRETVQSAFVSFCLDAKTSTSRAWGAYQFLQQFFQDADFERRTKLMQSFFDRKRPDMASHVFGHMRAHRNKVYHPTVDTYIMCLEGLSNNPDRQALEMVHNMLKMDTSIQFDTKLYTALMLAYASCDQSLAALDFWSEITRSSEGPSYASIEAVFWTLERKSGGDKIAREIWERIERMDLEVPPVIYNAYIGAIAAGGNEKEARGLVMQMASIVGTEPDAMTLGITYNALSAQELQSSFQDWAKKRYRQAWSDLEKYGRRMNQYSLCQFKIPRILKA